MPSMDERVAYLEGRVEDHYGAMADLRTDIRDIRTDFRDVRTEIRTEIGDVRTEIRELRADMNRQFHAMDTKINWVIGGQLATALAVIGALLKR
jgi:predicted  nucleic acid-binding Zn-ribbon protein